MYAILSILSMVKLSDNQPKVRNANLLEIYIRTYIVYGGATGNDVTYISTI